MIRTALLSLVAMLLSVATSNAQMFGTVEYQTVIIDGQSTPRFVMTANLPMANGLSWSLYAQTDRNWSEAYVGPAYAPVRWAQVGVGFGTEAYTNVTRKAAFAWLGYHQASVLGIVENGASGRFTLIDAKFAVQQVAAGYVYDSILGHGAKASLIWKPYVLSAESHERGSKLTVQYAF